MAEHRLVEYRLAEHGMVEYRMVRCSATSRWSAWR